MPKDIEAEELYMDSARTPPEIRDRAGVLRQNMSPFEKKIWRLVGAEGNPWGLLRQIPMRGYFLDFYSPQHMACIEADGPDHLKTADLDARRDAALQKQDVRTLRITPADFVRRRPLEILEMIGSFIETAD